MMLAGGVAGVLFAFAIPESPEPMARWTDFLKGANLPSALMTIALLATLIGGIALMAVGVGLQGERGGSGRAAMIVTALMTVVYFVVAATFVSSLGMVLKAVVVVVPGLVSAVLFMLAGHSASILKQFPPPSGLNDATPELLEEFRQKRLERLKHYEP